MDENELLESKIKSAIELIRKLKIENEGLNKKIKSMTIELDAIKSLREEKNKLKEEKEEVKKQLKIMLELIQEVKL